ncbi:MAG: PaaI family thioesterase [Alphaproteobacteria bacterium]|nr:PaaI family thioesterase [Alphaproteobacteria bacterium]MCW5739262.1 PaaI family thioesterase [Alphaproteobacteria bacterium]
MPERALALFQEWFSDTIPQNKALGLRVVGVRRGVVTMQLQWQPHLVGDAETGVLFGGAITTMLDACSGMAVATMLKEPLPFATLDLRIDYIKPATPRQAVIAEAECFKLTNNVAFTRAVAHHGDPADPIASSAGTFMMGTKGSVIQAQTLGARFAGGPS